MPDVRVTEEKTAKKTFEGDSYKVSFTDKALQKFADGEETRTTYEAVARKARLQPDVTVPSPDDLGQVLTEDVKSITATVDSLVKQIRTKAL
jgi:hypothetical protein